MFTIALATNSAGPRFKLSFHSALSQSDFCTQILILDNYTRRSKEEIKYLKSFERVKYVNTYQNIGMWNNFIRGYEMSDCQYFMWLADDDFIAPCLATVLASKIKAHPACIAWGGVSSYFDSSSLRISKSRDSRFESANPIARFKAVNTYRQWNYPFYFIHDKCKVSIALFKLLANSLLPLEGLDICWSIGNALLGKIHVTDQPLYFYDKSNWMNNDQYRNRRLQIASTFYLPEINQSYQKIDDALTVNRWFLYYIYCLGSVVSINSTYAEKRMLVSELSRLFHCNLFAGFPSLATDILPTVASDKSYFSPYDILNHNAKKYDSLLINPSASVLVKSFFYDFLGPQDRELICSVKVPTNNTTGKFMAQFFFNKFEKFPYILSSIWNLLKR